MIHQHMIYHGFVLGSSEFKSSATLVKVRILRFFFFLFPLFVSFSLGGWWGVGVVKTLNGKSLPG